MAQHFDLLISNAIIVDGTGTPGYPGDIGVSADRIVQIGHLDSAKADVKSTPAARQQPPASSTRIRTTIGCCFSAPDMAPKVSQGVTTVVAGNCGISLAPSPDRFARRSHAAAGSARRRPVVVSLPEVSRLRGRAAG